MKLGINDRSAMGYKAILNICINYTN